MELGCTLESLIQRHGGSARGRRKIALLVVDMQRDFMPSGSLPVPEADTLVPVINELMHDVTRREHTCLATKDWHPPNHLSFVPEHEGAQPGQLAPSPSRRHMVTLFDPHCVAGTWGAEFAEGLEVQHIQHTFHKGQDPGIEDYSGFYDMGRKHSTGLTQYLRAQEVDAVCVVGVALEYCVKATVLDALQDGFDTYLIVDAVKAVSKEAGERTFEELQEAGAKLVYLQDREGRPQAGGAGTKAQEEACEGGIALARAMEE